MRYLTKQQVCLSLQVTPRTVDRWIARGLLPKPKTVRNSQLYPPRLDAYARRRAVPQHR